MRRALSLVIYTFIACQYTIGTPPCAFRIVSPQTGDVFADVGVHLALDIGVVPRESKLCFRINEDDAGCTVGDLKRPDLRLQTDGYTEGVHSITASLYAGDGQHKCTESVQFGILPLAGVNQTWWNGHTTGQVGYQDTIERLLSTFLASVAPSFRLNSRFLGPSLDLIVDEQSGETDQSSPEHTAPPTSLVVAFGGNSSRSSIDSMMAQFSDAKRFTRMLFVYDNSDWSDMSWIEDTIVVRVQGKMKWWFVKRFLTPDVASQHRFIHVLDDDVTLPPGAFSIERYEGILEARGLDIAQPSHTADSQTTHQMLFQRVGSEGDWTNFAECGPFVSFRGSVWPCVYDLLQSDLVTGYGYDLLWGPRCAPTSTAVVHAVAVKHENTKGASRRPNFYAQSVAEGLTLFARERKRFQGTPGKASDGDMVDQSSIRGSNRAVKEWLPMEYRYKGVPQDMVRFMTFEMADGMEVAEN